MKEEDLVVGTKLLCLVTDDVLCRAGNIYEILEAWDDREVLIYVITDDMDFDFFNFKQLNGDIVSYDRKRKYVLESELTGKELFTLRMTGKIPEKLYD